MTMQLIETKTLLSAASSIVFISIPSTFTDLVLQFSGRNSNAEVVSGTKMSLNSNESISFRGLTGNGSSVSVTAGSDAYVGNIPGSSATSNTFGSMQIYVSNYASSLNKSITLESITENNATTASQFIMTHSWNNTSVVNSIGVAVFGGNFVAGSTASLYGITKGSDGITTVS